ncbi:MAG: RdgB/HAM1 family non-canonical purine NTP pyrophosphatase [Bacteroidota bacterium]
MTKLIFATNNEHKVEEIQAAVGDSIEVISLKKAGINIDIPEPYETLEENASAKSNTIHRLTKMNCFSEDTGLETESLNGEPGVKSARYAGDDKSFDKNIDKLLLKLTGINNRKARFRTVISLVLDKKEYFFEGICQGHISDARKGTNGFGYDPVFVPLGSEKSFAEMSMAEKNIFSHRKKAADKLIVFLQNYSAEKR